MRAIPGVRDHERDGIPCCQRQVRVAGDLVAVQCRDDVFVESQSHGSGSVAEPPRRDGLQARRVWLRQRPESPDLDFRSRELVRALIVGRLVEVAHRLQSRVERSECWIREHRLAAQMQDPTALEQERGPHLVGRDQLLDGVEQVDSVRSGQRLAIAADLWQDHVEVVAEPAQDVLHEPRVQQRDIRG